MMLNLNHLEVAFVLSATLASRRRRLWCHPIITLASTLASGSLCIVGNFVFPIGDDFGVARLSNHASDAVIVLVRWLSHAKATQS